MGKPKTNKAISSRFKKTKNGKVKHRKPSQAHCRSNKSGDKKRELRKDKTEDGPKAKKIKDRLQR